MIMKRAIVCVSAAIAFLLGTALHAQEEHPVRHLTNDPAQQGFPSWSPDGQTIVFSSVSQDSPEETGLWKISANGGEPWQVTEVIGEHPDWSPDGHYIAFDADSGSSIKLISSRGGFPIRVVSTEIPVFRGGNPNWAPDGRRIAFREGSNLWLIDIVTGQAGIALTREGMYPIPGCWSRDGAEVFVTLRSSDSAESEIWRVSASGAEARQVSFETDLLYRYMDLSPDGTLLAFTACKQRECDLWIGAVDGGKPIQLTFDTAYDDTPRWSPDGTKIAFTSTRSGAFDVWVMEPDLEKIRAVLISQVE
jgi:Tol biopolymer transport system component